MTMFSRRAFLKLTGLTAASLAVRFPGERQPAPGAPWPSGPEVRLGRVAWPWGVGVFSRPQPTAKVLRNLYPEDVAQIFRDVVGRGLANHTHVWNEIEDGYVYAPYLQPVKNIPQTPLTTLPGKGVWGEVCVPYVDARAKPEAKAPRVYRLYYSSVFLIKELHKAADGSTWYRAGTETDVVMYVPGETLRVIAAEELAPLAPTVDPGAKQIVVDVNEQALSAFEGQIEVFRARISSGALYFGEDGHTLTSGTPQGPHSIWQKRIARHMQGGTRDAGFDLPGVGWVSYFGSNGAALHSTYWHNDFGVPKSHGCLNCRPEDAKWLFRWTQPVVPYVPGDITVNWDNHGTVVDVKIEG